MWALNGEKTLASGQYVATNLGEPSRVSGRLKHLSTQCLNRPLTRLGSPTDVSTIIGRRLFS
jgi:hypothetical protein